MVGPTLTEIGHRGLPFAGPYGEPQVEAVLVAIEPLSPDPVLDVGCGSAGLLLRLVRRLGVRGTGLDVSPELIGRARGLAEALGLADRVELRLADASALPPPGAFRGAVCVGSTHVLGGLDDAARSLATLVGSGGALVIGDGYWARPPDAAALAGLGASADEYTSLGDARDRLGAAGLEILEESVSTPEDWDRYESAWIANVRGAGLDEVAGAHERGYREGYRRVLGFAIWTARVSSAR